MGFVSKKIFLYSHSKVRDEDPLLHRLVVGRLTPDQCEVKG